MRRKTAEGFAARSRFAWTRSCSCFTHWPLPASVRILRTRRSGWARSSERTSTSLRSFEDVDAEVDAAERFSPDVIVTDIAMAGIDGIAAAVLIRRHDPNARIVFLTVHAESMFVEAGL